jgi:hypothetical protein
VARPSICRLSSCSRFTWPAVCLRSALGSPHASGPPARLRGRAAPPSAQAARSALPLVVAGWSHASRAWTRRSWSRSKQARTLGVLWASNELRHRSAVPEAGSRAERSASSGRRSQQTVRGAVARGAGGAGAGAGAGTVWRASRPQGRGPPRQRASRRSRCAPRPWEPALGAPVAECAPERLAMLLAGIPARTPGGFQRRAT